MHLLVGTILTASTVLCSAIVPQKGMAQAVPFDTSRTVNLTKVLQWPMPAKVGPAAYLRNFGGHEGMNLVAFGIKGKTRLWAATPVLDSNDVQNVGNALIGGCVEVDYDGIPPIEYLDYASRVWKVAEADSPFPLEKVDSIGCLGDERTLVDVDGDGELDVVTKTISATTWYTVVLAGPDHGKGCSRAIRLPAGPYMNTPLRMLRCADGKLRVIGTGKGGTYYTGIYMLDVDVIRNGDTYDVSYSIADSLSAHNFPSDQAWVVFPRVAVDDSRAGRQYAVFHWQAGYLKALNATVVYDVSEGRFTEQQYNFDSVVSSGPKTFDNTFDDGPAVVSYFYKGKHYFARITDLFRPFASILAELGIGPKLFIDDQTGDGRRDLLVTSGTADPGSVTVFDFSYSVSNVHETLPTEPQWARLDGDILRLTLDQSSAIHIEVIDVKGSSRAVVSTMTDGTGSMKYDLSSTLSPLSPGLYLLRIQAGSRATTIKYIR